MLNNGGIKLSTCQSLTSKLRGCLDAGPREIPHVARFIQQRIRGHYPRTRSAWLCLRFLNINIAPDFINIYRFKEHKNVRGFTSPLT